MTCYDMPHSACIRGKKLEAQSKVMEQKLTQAMSEKDDIWKKWVTSIDGLNVVESYSYFVW